MIHGHLRRRAIAIILFCMMALLFFGNLYYTSPEVQQKIRTLVATEVSKITGGETSVGDIRIGILSATVTDLDLTVPINAVKIHLDRIKIGFSLGALLKREWAPEELVDRIIIISPTIEITPVAGEKQAEPIPTPKVIINTILNRTPFRTITLKNGQVKILTPQKKELFASSDLNGSITRKDGTLTIGVRGESILMETYLSKELSESYISIQAKEILINSSIPDSEITIKGLLNLTGEITFNDGEYPSCIEPEGKIGLHNLTVTDKGNPIVSKGEIVIVASEGEIVAPALSVDLLSYQIQGHLFSSLKEQGKSAISLKCKDPRFIANTDIAIESYFDREAKIQLSVKSEKDLPPAAFSAQGVLDTLGFTLEKYSLSLPDIKGEGKGAVDFKGNYNLNNTINLKKQLTPQVSLRTILKSDIESRKGSIIPSIRSQIYNGFLTLDTTDIKLPNLSIKTDSANGLVIAGKEKDFQISGKIESLLTPLKQYQLKLSIGKEKINEILPLTGLKDSLEEASIHAFFSGKEKSIVGQTDIIANGTFGNVTLKSKESWSPEKGLTFILDEGEWQKERFHIPFRASLQNPEKRWDYSINIANGTILSKGSLSEAFSEVIESQTLIAPQSVTDIKKYVALDSNLVRGGKVWGELTIVGPIPNIMAKANLHLQEGKVANLDNLHTTLQLSYQDSLITINPFNIYNGETSLFSWDKTILGLDSVSLSGTMHALKPIYFRSLMNNEEVDATISGTVKSQDKERLSIALSAPKIIWKELIIDSFYTHTTITPKKLIIDSLSFTHHKTKASVTASIPFTDEKTDTIHFGINAEGDFLGSAKQFSGSPVGGEGIGTLSLQGGMSGGELFFDSTSRLILPEGSLTVYPFVRGTVDKAFADIKFYRSDSISIHIRGKAKGKQIVIKNDYTFQDSISPFIFGPVNIGVLRVWSQKGGVPAFVPGFMENRPENIAFVEPLGKDDIPAFTLSGPLNRFRLSGTLLIRKAEITFPLLDDGVFTGESDIELFPFITFDMDIRPADRTVTYFYQLGDAKKRRTIRIIEATLDPSQSIGIRGREGDKTFRVVGGLRAFRGYLFYGKMFDKNFELGVDFEPEPMDGGGYDNFPIVWGSAEALGDSSRFDRSTVTVMTKDPETGYLRKKGRFTDLVIVPSDNSALTSFDDRRSIDAQGASFYTSTGKSITEINEAGQMVSGLGDRYISGSYLNYWGNQVARTIGLDVLRLETSVVSNSFNYLYERQEDSTLTRKFSYLALANTGVTVGKYIFGDNLMMKIRTELVPDDTLLTPSYKVGLEYQPIRYLWFDVNYGLTQTGIGDSMDYRFNPEASVQLRLPFSFFKRKKKKKILEK